MRLDARKGDLCWSVYHAERCEVLHHIVWIDDVTNEYYQLEYPLRIVGDDAAGNTHQARKIEIHVSRRVVIINPVEDAEGTPAATTEAIGQPA